MSYRRIVAKPTINSININIELVFFTAFHGPPRVSLHRKKQPRQKLTSPALKKILFLMALMKGEKQGSYGKRREKF